MNESKQAMLELADKLESRSKVHDYAGGVGNGISHGHDADLMRAAAVALRASAPQEDGRALEPRFFIDHGMIHDRETGKHVTTEPDSAFCDGIKRCCELLNALAERREPRAFPLLFDNNWLEEKIKEDPDIACEAGPALSAPPSVALEAGEAARETLKKILIEMIQRQSEKLVLIDYETTIDRILSALTRPQPGGAVAGTHQSASAAEPKGWPAKGDWMTFLGQNGYEFELVAALKLFSVGQRYEVEDCIVRNWSHRVKFSGIDGWHNGVMFEPCPVSRPHHSPAENKGK